MCFRSTINGRGSTDTLRISSGRETPKRYPYSTKSDQGSFRQGKESEANSGPLRVMMSIDCSLVQRSSDPCTL